MTKSNQISLSASPRLINQTVSSLRTMGHNTEHTEDCITLCELMLFLSFNIERQTESTKRKSANFLLTKAVPVTQVEASD